MTVKEIAEVTGKGERVVQMWAKRVGEKISSVGEKISSSTSTYPADYTKEETIEIIREGLGEVPASIYRAATGVDKSTKITADLPNGTQLRELRMIYGAEGAGRRLDEWIGFSGGVKSEIVKVPVAENIGRISKQAYAVEMRVRREQEQKQIEARDNPELFD